jgi:chromosome segregation ATPase
LQNVVSENTTLKSENTFAINKIQKLMQQVNELTSQNSALTTQVKQKDDIVKQYNALKSENSTLQSQLQKVQTDLTGLLGTQVTSAAAQTELNTLKNQTQKQISMLQNDIKVHQDALEKQKSDYELELQKLRQQLLQSQNQLSTEVTAKENAIQSLRDEQLRHQQDVLKIQNEEVQKISSASSNAEGLKADNELLNSRIKELETKNSKLIQEHIQANEYLVRALTGLRKIRDNLETLAAFGPANINQVFKDIQTELTLSEKAMGDTKQKLRKVEDVLKSSKKK